MLRQISLPKLFKQYLPLITTLLLGVIVGWQIQHAWITWRQDYLSSHPVAEKHVVAPLTPLEQLPHRHLFGRVWEGSRLLPPTSLSIHLTGITKMNANTVPSKVYLVFDETSHLYQVGDRLLNGVTIVAITHDAVVLDNHNHFEQLSLKRE